MLEKTTRMNLLYDYYHPLLTAKQKQYMELYYHDDYSLGEIAEQFEVSRQAVFEHVKRAENLLEQYESMLKMAATKKRHLSLLEELEHLIQVDDHMHKQNVLQLIKALKNTD